MFLRNRKNNFASDNFTLYLKQHSKYSVAKFNRLPVCVCECVCNSFKINTSTRNLCLYLGGGGGGFAKLTAAVVVYNGVMNCNVCDIDTEFVCHQYVSI